MPQYASITTSGTIQDKANATLEKIAADPQADVKALFQDLKETVVKESSHILNVGSAQVNEEMARRVFNAVVAHAEDSLTGKVREQYHANMKQYKGTSRTA